MIMMIMFVIIITDIIIISTSKREQSDIPVTISIVKTMNIITLSQSSPSLSKVRLGAGLKVKRLAVPFQGEATVKDAKVMKMMMTVMMIASHLDDAHDGDEEVCSAVPGGGNCKRCQGDDDHDDVNDDNDDDCVSRR